MSDPSRLARPGLHKFGVRSGPYSAMVRVDVPEASERTRKIASAALYVDANVVKEAAFEDYEDDLLRAVGRALGAPVSWAMGDWTRGPNGAMVRYVGIGRPHKKLGR